jgi:ketosteroid isomerase-like protein
LADHDSSAAALIRRYHDFFNQRRLHDAAALVAHDCEFEHTATRERVRGPRGYLAIAEQWLRAVPDAKTTVEGIEALGNGRYRVHLAGEGHRLGAFEVGATSVHGDGKPFRFTAVQEITIADGRIASARLTYNRDDVLT